MENYLDVTHQGTAKDTKVCITLFKFLNPRAHGQKWFVTTYKDLIDTWKFLETKIPQTAIEGHV